MDGCWSTASVGAPWDTKTEGNLVIGHLFYRPGRKHM